ncbi:MAG: group II intron reverse transcriptase domain-containing protein [Pseudomonadales bacterium]|nr:group II intron reverse transcriptase domain-containing protein [Candidatus Woesebacteria bacterium]MCB9801092.1 group II intron reverse transcriptase domain-containing protein [Pseudomonadales bacterium]
MFDEICNLEQLLKAYSYARRGKREKKRVCEYDFSLESNLIKLRYLLLSDNYSPAPYAHFTVYDPKTRSVSAPAFRDRVLQHSLVSTIEPIFEKRFIYDSYACRKGKGTHFGAKRIKKFLMAARCKYGKQQDFYVLQCDIQKYFQNIDWDILLSIISKVIHCERTLNLIRKIIVTHESTDNSSVLPQMQRQLDLFSQVQVEVPPVRIDERKGLPIGNLTSQLFANVYLNELDHFVKERLKERWYARYMDDFLIIHPDKNHLIKTRDRIAEYLDQTLNLRLHPRKITIKNVQEGVPFVGYRIFYDHTLVRGDTLRHMQRKYRYKTKLHQKGKISDLTLAKSQTSIQGHLKHANAHGLYAFMTNNRV